LSKSSCHHNGLQKSRIAGDEADVQSLLTTLEGWMNPFQGDMQDLICLSTGKMASEDVLVISYKLNSWVKEHSKVLARRGWRPIPEK